MSDLQFIVKGKSESATKLVTTTREFEVVVDEPEALGGKDEAANPVEYILIGLAGCVNVVAHNIANEIGFEIDSLEIETSGNLNPSKFLGISDDQRAGFKDINVKLFLEANATDLQLNNWLSQINKRCPVKDNLFAATPVTLSLKSNQLAVFG